MNVHVKCVTLVSLLNANKRKFILFLYQSCSVCHNNHNSPYWRFSESFEDSCLVNLCFGCLLYFFNTLLLGHCLAYLLLKVPGSYPVCWCFCVAFPPGKWLLGHNHFNFYSAFILILSHQCFSKTCNENGKQNYRNSKYISYCSCDMLFASLLDLVANGPMCEVCSDLKEYYLAVLK
jgi:hypothetical protein